MALAVLAASGSGRTPHAGRSRGGDRPRAGVRAPIILVVDRDGSTTSLRAHSVTFTDRDLAVGTVASLSLLTYDILRHRSTASNLLGRGGSIS
jgi:hypothetical protein